LLTALHVQEEWAERGAHGGGSDEASVTTEAAIMLMPDRRRQIDVVIDYFGESREPVRLVPDGLPG
jgi:hypothetical protein